MRIEFKDVSVSYDELHALAGFNLTVGSGESVAIIGPSGCGKSTMLRLAAGLMAPSSGVVLADGEPITHPRQEVALILQDYGLLPWKSVLANAELGLRIRRMPRKLARERAMAALQQVGLAPFARMRPKELSGGMQQRLALARSIALESQVLLMDEPLSALDALLREDLQDLLLETWLERHHTQILVTHSIEEAVFLGQRIVVMAPRPGRVVAQIDNPRVGEAGYRSSQEFFDRCTQVRDALHEGGAR